MVHNNKMKEYELTLESLMKTVEKISEKTEEDFKVINKLENEIKEVMLRLRLIAMGYVKERYGITAKTKKDEIIRKIKAEMEYLIFREIDRGYYITNSYELSNLWLNYVITGYGEPEDITESIKFSLQAIIDNLGFKETYAVKIFYDGFINELKKHFEYEIFKKTDKKPVEIANLVLTGG